jgi:MarR-like DNA-binding transcriptional regulator SgrR of sgrS sRNA
MNRLLLSLALALWAAAAPAASRAQFGGTLRFAVAHRIEESDPFLADTPWEAAILSLQARSICELTATFSSQNPTVLRVSLPPSLRRHDGAPLTAREVAQSWLRAITGEVPSPYRAHFAALKNDRERPSIAAVGANELLLSLDFPWPDLESSLCHPALALVDGKGSGIGPFEPTKAAGTLLHNSWYPRGGPFVDRVLYLSASERALSRKIELGQIDVALNHAGPGALAGGLFTTYLLFNPARAGPNFRAAFEAAIDKSDLARFFAAPPAEPVHALFPNAIDAEPTPEPAPTAVPPSSAELMLLYDSTLEDQRRVAERIQVKLHRSGYRIALRPVARRTLRQRWAKRDFDLLLMSVMLPPRPAAALAVVLELASEPERMRAELPPLGLVSEASARAAKAKERAKVLASQLPLIGLYAQAMRLYIKPNVEALVPDAYGLPQLDDAFLRSP